MKNIVISLTSATQRREHIIQEFGKQNIAFEFFDAITPDLIEQTCQKLGVDLTQNKQLSNGEKGCFLSHVSLWQKCIDENLDYIAIFEDDVYLGENAHLFFNDDEWLKGYDFFKMEITRCKYTPSINDIKTLDNRVLFKLENTHLGGGSYILSNKQAKLLLEFIKNYHSSQLVPVDNMIFEEYLKLDNNTPCFQLYPAVVIQNEILELIFGTSKQSLISQLTPERVIHHKTNIAPKKEKTPFAHKIKRELLRPFIQIIRLFKSYFKKEDNRGWFR